ncbi:hypothetical protein BG000_004488 [Podila horticola]|nr:hypothetical protein BG000_004488 [Podila horticola]
MEIESRFAKLNTVGQVGLGILKVSRPSAASFDLLLADIVGWFIADELQTELDSVLDITEDSGHGYRKNRQGNVA